MDDTNNPLQIADFSVIGERHEKRHKDREKDANTHKDVLNTIFSVPNRPCSFFTSLPTLFFTHFD